jgi:uncharacterized protein
VNVLELWRYPVKSMQGEQVAVADVTAHGIAGDRVCAIFDVDTGFGLTARRVPELLFASARWLGDGGVEITVPDGSVARGDDALSEWLGRRVELRSTATGATRQRLYENPLDFEHEATTPWAPFEGASAAFHDSSNAHVSMLSTATVGAWDRRRFRANVVLHGAGEDDLVGTDVGIGDAVFHVRQRIPRCIMTTRAQPDGIARDLDVLRTVNRERAGFLAVGAVVARAGTVRVGDELIALASAG